MNKNKIFAFLGKYYYIILPVLISFGTVAFLRPWYDLAGDDVALANIVHSAQFNPNSEFLLFVSVILGYVMRFAALAFPTLNVYGITLLLALTFGFSVFFYNTRKYKNKLISVPFVSFLQVYMIYGITFTAVSFVCCAAAVLLIIENVKECSGKSVKFFILSFFLLLIGLGFRRTHLVTAVGLIMVPVCFFAVKQKRITIPVLIVLVVMFAGSNLLIKTTQNIYTQNLFAGTEYMEFNQYRAAGTDSGDLYYGRHKEYFDANGVSKNDVDLFRNFFYSDKTVFPTDKAKVIAESFSFADKYTLDPLQIISVLVKVPFVIVFLALALLCFIIQKKDRKEIFSYAFVILGAIAYLAFRKRGVVRVIKPIVLIGMMLLLYIFLHQGIEILTRKWKNIFKIAVPACVLVLIVGLSVYQLPEAKSQERKDLLEYIRNDEEHYYVPVNGITLEKAFTFNRLPISPADNLLYSIYRGWTVHSPYWYSLLERYGLEEYKDCIYLSTTDEKVKIICRSEEEANMFVLAAEEHYNKKVVIKKDKEFKECFVCQLVADTEEETDLVIR